MSDRSISDTLSWFMLRADDRRDQAGRRRGDHLTLTEPVGEILGLVTRGRSRRDAAVTVAALHHPDPLLPPAPRHERWSATPGLVMDLGLTGKVALVTGASKGLGLAIAEEFAKEGANVSICARGKEGLDEAVLVIEGHGVEVLGTPADVSRLEDIEQVVDATLRRFGRVDVLVNNAGDAWIGRSVDTTEQEWQYCMDVNLNSAVRFTRLVVPYMRGQGGGRVFRTASAPPTVVRLPLLGVGFVDGHLGRSGGSTPTLTARSSAWTTNSITRVRRKSSSRTAARTVGRMSRMRSLSSTRSRSSRRFISDRNRFLVAPGPYSAAFSAMSRTTAWMGWASSASVILRPA